MSTVRAIKKDSADTRYVNESDHTKPAHDALDIDADTLDGLDSAALEKVANKGVASGYASLDAAAKVPSAQLPALALTDVYTVASEAEQLALAAQEGDVAVRTDINKSFAHNGGAAGTMADWTELRSPTAAQPATEATAGIVELATAAETLSGTDSVRAVHPSGLAGALPFVNVKRHGAVGDDVADDTAAIQAALDSLDTTGGVLFFPRGTYRVSAALEVPNNVTLTGENMWVSVIKPLAAMPLTSNVIVNRVIDSATSARTAQNIVIEDLGFDGSARTYPRWLEHVAPHASAGTPVSDPAADYYDASTNPSGKIGNPSYAADPDSVALAQSKAAAGNLTLTASPVQVDPVRKVTITSSGNDSALTFTITGTDYGGAPLEVALAGTNASIATTDVVFRTVSQIAVSGATAGTVSAGTARFDIFGTVAEGRRNSAYSTQGTMIALYKVVAPVIRRCRFTSHRNMVISDNGCLDGHYYDNRFENCLKKDGPFFCIWVQSYGKPTDPPVYYAPSEGTVVERNVFRDLERIAVLFAPAAGGECRDNTVSNAHESGIFVPENANHNGGHTVVEGNRVKGIRISDITASGMESYSTDRVTIRNNVFEDVDCEALNIQGGTDKVVEGNEFRNVWQMSGGYPYGPFSERYGFNIGLDPIAGNTIPSANRSIIRLGSSGADACVRNKILANTFIDSRANGAANLPSATFRVERVLGAATGSVKSVDIEDNDLRGLPSDLRSAASCVVADADVFDADVAIGVRHNQGHNSRGAYVFEHTFPASTTGLVTFDTLGFRPRYIKAMIVSATASDGKQAEGHATWQPGVLANASARAAVWTNLTTGTRNITSTIFLILVDTAGAVVWQAPLNAWLHNGFRVNVSTATQGAKVVFSCEP